MPVDVAKEATADKGGNAIGDDEDSGESKTAEMEDEDKELELFKEFSDGE